METKEKEQAGLMSKVQKLPVGEKAGDCSGSKCYREKLKEIWDRKYAPIRKAIEDALRGE
jgi:hypothetical protein